MDTTNRKFGLLEVASPPLHVLNLFIVAAATTWFARTLAHLPASIPVHWSATGPNRWSTPHEMWLFLAVLLMNTALMAGLVIWVARRQPKTGERAGGLATTREEELESRQLGARFVEWMFLIFDVAFAGFWVVAVKAAAEMNVRLINVGVAVLFVGVATAVIGPMALTILRVRRARERLGGRVLNEGYVAGGMLYYAPDDPRLLVPKTIGWGHTFNFARPMAWVILCGILGLPLVLTLAILATIP